MDLSYHTLAKNEAPDMPLVLESMLELQAERHKDYRQELIERWPVLTTITKPTFLGSFSWSCLGLHTRWLMESNVYDFGAGHCTPAELARDYIRVKYKRQRATAAQKHEITKRRFSPLYARVGTYPDCVYLDIRSAYWTIVQTVGWDVQYFPNRWLGKRSECNDFPAWKIKLARNCLVSVGLSGATKMWTGEALKFLKRGNPNTNIGLWSLAQDVLHGVADEMVRGGAYYVHTDGYIIRKQDLPLAFEILSSWGFEGRIKHEGLATIFGVGQYRVGGFHTENLHGRMTRDFSNIIPQYPKWLKYRFHRFSEATRLLL